MRNFLYNNSAILVALGIVVAAGLLIFWKMEALLNYAG